MIFLKKLLVTLAFAGTTLFCSEAAISSSSYTSGPFEILPTVRKISAGGFPNTTSNPFKKMEVSEFALRHRGKPVSIDTPDGTFSEFYEAWFLEHASTPAVLVALQSFYLVTDTDGRLTITQLSQGTDDLASYQWLDADGGQPSAEQSVAVRDRRGEPRSLGQGNLLLLNHDAVLQLNPLKYYPVHAPLHSPDVWDYAVAGEPAKALSPGKTDYVLAGDPDGDPAHMALAVINIARDRGYAVPFDGAALGVASVWDVTPAWVGEHFQWVKSADGGERLVSKPTPAR